MSGYVYPAVVLVIVTTILFTYILHKKKLLTLQYLFSILISSIGSIIISILFPLSLDTFTNVYLLQMAIAIIVTLMGYITVVLLLTVFISSVITEKSIETFIRKIKMFFQNFRNKISKIIFSISEVMISNKEKKICKEEEKVHESEEKAEEKETFMLKAEEIHEKLVDTQQNIDKMRVEEFSELNTPEEINENLIEGDFQSNDIEPIFIQDYIEQAFRYKEKEEFEKAIECYMEVLERRPDNSTIFWIVLDICVMYKNLGQTDLAKDILSTYMEAYGNLMDSDIKNEIEKNL